MAYQALYRTYRPKDFYEVAGQEHITKTFKNALLNNKLAHAYLFSGPRGTGKTSVAKIIAKAVNCEHAPVANPCNTCDICLGINNNTISDVLEIDAASNNGVDEIRELRDKVKYLPGVGKYKVYIIDEVHMLSISAFNALLKTLEEPPKHVIFILATTEPHKIPATIHSRCQRFDFRGIGIADMLDKLNEIAEKESINIEEDALHLIAESAEGGMRDAISLLDQVVSYTNETVTLDDVHAIKGTVSHESIITIAKSIEDDEVPKAIDKLDYLVDQGKEAHKLLDDMIKFYRDILLFNNIGNDNQDKLLYRNETFRQLATALSNSRVFHYIDILHDTQQKVRYTASAKLYVELAFVKMVDIESNKQLIATEKIDDLERKVNLLSSEVESQKVRTVSQDNTPTPSAFSDDVSFKPKEEKGDVDDYKSIDEPNEEKEEKEEEKALDKDTEEEQYDPLENKFIALYRRYSKKQYKTFDIHYVEDVLNTADREIKIDMVKKWYDIERVVNAEDMQYAKLITEGTLVATNGVMLLVAYDSFAMCNRLMSKELKANILRLLERYFDRQLMFMALPNEIWESISAEFVKKFRKKQASEDFITLTKIDHPRLVEIPNHNEDYKDVESDSVKEAKTLFGDIVKVKKEGE
ncbi:MAG: DNA polymerase III subunit gamma/tau [Bacillota bacterium]